MHPTWSLAHEVLNVQKLHLHLAMAAMPWNLCASIPASPWPSSSLLVPKVQKPPACQQLPIRNRARPYTLPLLLVFLPARAKTCPAPLFCPAILAVLAVPFHLRKLILTRCKISWLSNCFLIWCITESISIFHQSCGKSLSTSLFTKITSLLVTEMFDGCSPCNKD